MNYHKLISNISLILTVNTFHQRSSQSRSDSFAMDKISRDSALLIQRTWRRHNAAHFVYRRKTYDTMRAAALLAVGPNSLYLSYVKEMRDRIRRAVDDDGSTGYRSTQLKGSKACPSQHPLPHHQAIMSSTHSAAEEDRDSSSYPPDEVLQLLRLVLIIIQGGRPQGSLRVTSYTPSGGRTFDDVDGRNLSWTQAYKVTSIL